MSDRVTDFLSHCGLALSTPSPVAAGASTRRYTRFLTAEGTSVLLMDTGGGERTLPLTPYEQTIMPDLRPFARVCRILTSLKMSVPKIYAESDDGHLLLVEDFGERELERLLQADAPPFPLFTLTVDALLELQRRFEATQPDMNGLRHYTADFFLSHLAVIPDVYMPLLCGAPPSAEARQAFDRAWHSALTRACATPTSLMLRDFSLSNTFYLPERQGIDALGLIDFETAGTGPMIYDLASMLRANRYHVPDDVVETCKAHFLAGVPKLNKDEFDAAYHIFATMRQVQWAGSCALYTTQGRTGFLKNLPGIWQLIEGILPHPALTEVRTWFDTHIPPSARREPGASS